MQWAVEGGLPFLALLLGIAVWSVRPALRSLWGVGILSVWLHALVDYPMQQRPALTVFFFALLGALASQERENGAAKNAAAKSDQAIAKTAENRWGKDDLARSASSRSARALG